MSRLRITVKPPKASRFERSEEGQALVEGYVLWQRIVQAFGKRDLNTLKRKHGNDFRTKQYTSKRVYYSIDDVVAFLKIPGLEDALRVRRKGAKRVWSILQSRTSGQE